MRKEWIHPMTEHKPFYHAHSSITDLHTSSEHVSTTIDPLTCHLVDGTISRDRILLLPILQAGTHDDETQITCMHIIHLPDSDLGFCNTEVAGTCYGCSRPICEAHTSLHSVWLPNLQIGVHRAPLCEMCAALPREAMYALRTFCRLMNQPTDRAGCYGH